MGDSIPYSDVLGGNKIDMINKSRSFYYYNSYESLKSAAEAGTEETSKKQ
jgi:hypothetical protein